MTATATVTDKPLLEHAVAKPDRRHVRNGQASICDWTLEFSFLLKEQAQEFLSRYMAETPVPMQFAYHERMLDKGTQHRISVSGSWASNLGALATILEDVDFSDGADQTDYVIVLPEAAEARATALDVLRAMRDLRLREPAEGFSHGIATVPEWDDVAFKAVCHAFGVGLLSNNFAPVGGAEAPETEIHA